MSVNVSRTDSPQSEIIKLQHTHMIQPDFAFAYVKASTTSLANLEN